MKFAYERRDERPIVFGGPLCDEAVSRSVGGGGGRYPAVRISMRCEEVR